MRDAGGRLQGKVALVVGGGTGIGEAAARRFAREGARVMIGDVRPEAAAAVAQAINVAAASSADLGSGQGGVAIGAAHGGDAAAVAMDATSDASVAAAVAATVERFGALHVLFDCAGGSLPDDSPVTDVDLSIWAKTMTLDGFGTLLCCRHAIPAIIAAGGGSVVLMSSGAALRGSGRAHVYAAAKGAVVSLTRAMAGAYARGNVRVNAICSGRINTERVRRTYGIPGQPGASADAMRVDEQVKTYPFWFGEPDDIAHIALFLASDESRMITGAAIPADGGRSAY